ncbi:MAG: polyisoprenoid-binding protein [Betaproteobacteria bacterium]|nr:MAG: polyisoprenoid-binding protein [Betaproteobacteria bacterium]
MTRLAIALLISALPLAATAAPETYILDPYHTYPNFTVDHLGFSTLHGRFDRTSGKFIIDRTARTASVEMTVETASINAADNEKGSRQRSRDDHLRSPDFFNVAEYPRMTFKSTNVKFSGDHPATIEGNLTLLGVTRPMVLQVERWKCGPHPFNKKEMCGGNASGMLKRSDFGMKFGLPLAVSDDVRLMIGFEAYRE